MTKQLPRSPSAFVLVFALLAATPGCGSQHSDATGDPSADGQAGTQVSTGGAASGGSVAQGYGGSPATGGSLESGGAPGGGSGGVSESGGAPGGDSGGSFESAGGSGGGTEPAFGGTDAGGASSGGASSGGASSGGAPSGGTSSGGTSSGGTSSGGAPSGGASSGGAPSGGASSGGATSGGASAVGGAVGACPVELVGWAAVSGDGVGTTTGGGEAAPVRPATLGELEAYARDEAPRVIEIDGTWDLDGRLDVASNKTILGLGPDAQLNGGLRIRGSSGDFVRNVIVRNLKVNGASSDVDGDAVQIHFAHHVWIDHCEIWDAPDGNLDVVHGSNWVTISWTKFRYTPAAPDPSHKFSTLIGHSDSNAGEDEGRLKVTLHHDWWAEGVTERMPRARFGQVHSFNNYFSSAGNNYCIRAGRSAHILSEHNYFDGVRAPHEFNNSADEGTAHITARHNTYSAADGEDGSWGGGTPFTAPGYPYEPDAAGDVPDLVRRCAGPQ